MKHLTIHPNIKIILTETKDGSINSFDKSINYLKKHYLLDNSKKNLLLKT